jgi:hypothetical protein
LIARLDDPWFEAEFQKNTTAKGHEGTDSLEGADGIFLWCPCGYGKPGFPLDGARPHGLIVSFANPRGCPPAPPDAGSRSAGGGPSRWTIVSGTGLSDLTLSPSVDVGSKTSKCWHGFIQNGIVT